jgi:predicted RNA binding protein YcfA (HicA-like mRNA interferase family)
MKGGYRRAVIEILERNGYWKLPDSRGKGSHEAWSNGKRTQIVPRNIDDRAFANRLMKQAGIGHRFD